jgi:hypothetical protein
MPCLYRRNLWLQGLWRHAVGTGSFSIFYRDPLCTNPLPASVIHLLALHPHGEVVGRLQNTPAAPLEPTLPFTAKRRFRRRWRAASPSGLFIRCSTTSVVGLAEDLGSRRLATRDVRHFAAVRLFDGSAFELVVHPSDPDR